MREKIAQHTYYGASGKTIPQRASATGEDYPQRPPDLPAASRHRAGHGAGLHPEDQPYLSGAIYHSMPPPSHTEEVDADDYPQRSRSSVVIRRNITTGTPISRSQAPPARRSRRKGQHWLFSLGIGMLCSVILYVAFNGLSSWWQHTQDDWHYGYPRTYQTDAVVGHGIVPAIPVTFLRSISVGTWR